MAPNFLTLVLTLKDIKLSTRVMLALEAVLIILIIVLSFVILFKVASSSGLSAAPFQSSGNDVSTIAKGTVFGLLCFAGFEGASSLGEETKNPKKLLPIVIGGTVVSIGVFFLLSSYTQVIGFGINPEGIAALSQSSAPLKELSSKFISDGYGKVLTLGISLALFYCTIGTACAGSRILYSLSRDGRIHKSLSSIHLKYNTPHIAVSVIMITSLVLQATFFKKTGTEIYNYSASIASLSIIVAYVITSIAASVYFTKNKIWKGRHIIIPIISILALAYTFYSNVYPVPDFPMNVFPYVIIGWIIFGLVLSLSGTTISENVISNNEEAV